ncbi:MAG: aspartyl protease family protein [Sphingomicrobium sp.]
MRTSRGSELDFKRAAFAALLLLVALLPSSPLRATDLVLDHASGFVIPVQVNGHTLRLRVDTGANGVIVLNPEAAERVGLRELPGNENLALALGIGAAARTDETQRPMLDDVPVVSAPTTRTAAQQNPIRPFILLGPLLAQGKFGIARTSIGGSTGSKLFAWFDDPAVTDVDGLISPAELPYSNVTLRLSPSQSGERTVSMDGQYTPLSGFTVPIPVYGHIVNVKLSVVEPFSVATAGAGSAIAQTHQGAWAGDLRAHHIALGVLRPVRPMVLRRAMDVRGLRVSDFLVRVRDNGGRLKLPEVQATIATDPDEIVVVAPSANQPVRFLLVLGTDQLGSCSSVTYQRRSVRLLVRCSGK